MLYVCLLFVRFINLFIKLIKCQDVNLFLAECVDIFLFSASLN